MHNENQFNKKKLIEILLFGLASFVLVLFDQYTKVLAVEKLQNKPFVIWDGVFEFHFTTNHGAAFGIFQNQTTYFLIVTTIMLLIIGYSFWKMPQEKKYVPMKAILALLTAGAFGNLIDRSVNGYVVDFLYFKLINFPIFNVADCYVCIAAFFFVVVIMFYYEDGDFAALVPKKWRKTNDRIG